MTSASPRWKLFLDKMIARRRMVEGPSRRRPELLSVRIVVAEDPEPDDSYLNEAGREAFERGEFRFVGIRAEADVTIEGVPQTLVSGSGTWGIESDADEYIKEVVAHEWGVLRLVLKQVGVSTSELPVEVDRVWIEWRT